MNDPRLEPDRGLWNCFLHLVFLKLQLSFWRRTRTSHSLSCYAYWCRDSGSLNIFFRRNHSASSLRVENFWEFPINEMIIAALRSWLNSYYLWSLHIVDSVGLSAYMDLDTFFLSLFGSYSAILALRSRIEVWIASHCFAAWFPEEEIFVKWYVSTAFSLSCEKVLHRKVGCFVEIIRKWKWVHSILVECPATLVSMDSLHWVRCWWFPPQVAESRSCVCRHW